MGTKHASASSANRPDHHAEWPWFAEWALWVLGRGQYREYGTRNPAVRPLGSPSRIPRHAWEILRELQGAEEDPDAPITEQSPLLAPPRAGSDAIEYYVVNRDHSPTSDEDALEVAGLYFVVAERGGLDVVIAVAQMVLETGNLKSRWVKTHKNLAGIGIPSDDTDPADVPSWDTWEEAVVGHVGRLLAYAIPLNQENDVQRELIEAALAKRRLQARYRGSAPTLGGLQGTWAMDEQYGEKLTRVANAVRDALRPL